MSIKEKILTSQDLNPEKLHVPEWGVDVYIRVMSGFERDSFEAEIGGDGKRNLANIRAKLAVRVLCDETGKRIFELKDAAELGQKSAAALDRIFTVATRVNRIGEKDVDELVGNSMSGQSEDSGTV